MKEIEFCSASYGEFGIIRMGALIPESHILLVCPPACGRHITISLAAQGMADRISCYMLDESEVVLGTSMDGISHATETIIHEIRPTVLLVYLCCIMYISGLDEKLLKERLSCENPGTEIQICRMNPVSFGTASPPAVTMQDRMYELLDITGPHGGCVNFIGGSEPPARGGEIYEILAQCGFTKCSHVAETGSYSEFKSMGSAGLNIVIASYAVHAAEMMSEEIPYVVMMPEYTMKGLRQQYETLFAAIDRQLDLSVYEAKTHNAVESAVNMIGGKTIAVGSSATARPFHLARALFDYGFNVTAVFADDVTPAGEEAEDLKRLKSTVPDLQVFDTRVPGMEDRIGRCGVCDISIGYNAAYFSGSRIVVDVLLDRGLFGYAGIEGLMKAITDSLKECRELGDMIDDAHLVM